MSNLYQNVLIGDIVRAFEEMNLVSGNVETKPNGDKTITIKFEAKTEDVAI